MATDKSNVVLIDDKWVEVLAKIDKDYINEGDDIRRGTQWTENEVKGQSWFDYGDIEFEQGSTRFRCKDDDGEVYYGGWLYNDDACIMQQIVISWAMHDAGCTIIEVKDVNDRWQQEIG